MSVDVATQAPASSAVSSSPLESAFSFASSSSSSPSAAASSPSVAPSDASLASTLTPLSTVSAGLRGVSGSTNQPGSASDTPLSSPSPTVSHKRKHFDGSHRSQRRQQRQEAGDGQAVGSDQDDDDANDDDDNDLSDGQDDDDDEDDEDDSPLEELEEVETTVVVPLTEPNSNTHSDTIAASADLAALTPDRSQSTSSPTAAFAQLTTASSAASPLSLSSSTSLVGEDSTNTAAATSQTFSTFPSTTTSTATTPTTPHRSTTRKSRPNDWFCFQGCGKHYKKSSGRSIRRHALSCYRTHHPEECGGMSDMEVHAMLAVKQEDGEVQTGLRAWRLRQSRRQASDLPQHERWECPNGCKQFYRSTSSKSIEKHMQTCTYKPDDNTQQRSSSASSVSSRAASSPSPIVKQEAGSSGGTPPSPLNRTLLAGLSTLTSPFPLASTSLTPQQLAILQQHAHNEAVMAAMQQQQMQQQQQQLLSQSLANSILPSMQQQPQLAVTSQQLLQLQQALYMQQQQQQQKLSANSHMLAPMPQLFLPSANSLSNVLNQHPMMADASLASPMSVAGTGQHTHPGSFGFPSSFSATATSSSSFLAPSPSSLSLQHFQQQLSAPNYLSGLSQPSPFSLNVPLLSAAMAPSPNMSFSLSSLPPLSSHSMLQPITSVSTSAHSLSAASTMPTGAQSTPQSMLGGLASLLQPNVAPVVGLHAGPFSSATSTSSPTFAPLQAASLNLTASFPSSALASASFAAAPLSAIAAQPFPDSGRAVVRRFLRCSVSFSACSAARTQRDEQSAVTLRPTAPLALLRCRRAQCATVSRACRCSYRACASVLSH